MELTKTFQKIATGDAVVYGGASGYLELWAKYNSQDIPNNRTNVTVELRLVVTYGYIGNYQATYWNINGDLSKSGNLGSGDYRSRILGSVTGDIEHNPDGTKTISFSGEFNPTAWGYSMEVEGDATLPTLHTPPEITNVGMTETNSQLTNIEVANNTIVQYLSNKKVTITAPTFDSATITNYSIYHNNVLIGTSTSNSITINFSNVGELIDSGTGNIGLMIAVTDNLGGYNTKIFNFPIIKYTRPTYEGTSTNIRRKTTGGVALTDNIAVLNFVGTCYKGNDVIGNANKPSVKYKIWNGTEPNYSDLTISNSANVVVKDFEIHDIEYTKSYQYKIKINDVFTNSTEKPIEKVDKVSTGISVWTEYKDRVDFLNITIGGKKVAANDDVGKTAMAWLSSDFSFSANQTHKIPFDNFETDDESYFELVDNGIKVLKECTLLVWLQWTTWGTYSRYAYIVLNDGQQESFASVQTGTVQTKLLLKCKPNDIIYGKCHAEGENGMSATKNQTNLQVIIIK